MSIALAIAIRCLSPPESFTPRSPTKVSYLSGKLSIKLLAWANLAAFLISFSVAFGLPYFILSLSVCIYFVYLRYDILIAGTWKG